MIVHITRATRHFLFVTLISVALCLTGIRVIISTINNYKITLAQTISHVVGSPVTIGKLGAKMRGVSPELQLKNIQIAEKITIQEIRVGGNLWKMVRDQDFFSSMWITIIGANLTITHKNDDSIIIEGIAPSEEKPVWLFQGKKYLLLQSAIQWNDEKNALKPIKIEQVNGAILNDGEHHRINLLTKQKQALRISLDFTGNPFELTTVNGNGYVETQNIELAPFLPIFEKSNANLALWLHFQHGNIQTATGHFSLKNTVLYQQNQKIDLIDASSHFQFLRFNNEDWQFKTSNLNFQFNETNLKSHVLITGKNAEILNIGAFFPALNLTKLPFLLNFPVQGELENVRFFSDLKTQGAAQFTLNQGEFVSDLFRQSLNINQFNTTLTWQKNLDNWQITSPKTVLKTPDIQINSHFQFTIPLDLNIKNSFLDLQMAFQGGEINQAKRYFPAKIMDKEVVDWLDSAFVKGRLTKGDMIFYGKLNDFPFEKNQGVFETLFHVENTELFYAPDWLPITDMNAEILFFQNGLHVDLKGKSGNAIIDNATVNILDFTNNDSVLITGNASGDVNSILHFIKQSPEHGVIDSILEVITPQGYANVALNLKIPLSDNKPAQVSGTTQFKNAKLHFKALDLPIGQINGDLKFNEKGIFSDAIHAVALNKPIFVTLKNTDLQTNIRVLGRADIETLKQHFDLPFSSSFIEGESDYALDLTLPNARNEATKINLTSSLFGITLKLPDDLAKTKMQKTPFTMDFLLNPTHFPITLNYNDKIRANLIVNAKTKQVDDAEILIGQGQLEKANHFNATLNRDELALDKWLAVAFDKQNTNRMQRIRIQTPHAFWKNTPLGLFELTLENIKNEWRGNVDTAFTTGKITLPSQTENTLGLQLDFLNFSTLPTFKKTNSKSVQSELKENALPSIKLKSEKTLWREINLGQLTFTSQPVENGIEFNNFSLIGDYHTLNLTGHWRENRTELQGNLEFPKAGTFFNKFNISKDLTDAQGEMKLSFYWRGAPSDFSLNQLNGQIYISLNQGRILSIEPGFGRILGMLAFEQWLKRLQLDFSDLYQEGLTFNTIKGYFEITNGKAFTKALIVDAIPAKIVLNGELDFNQQTVNFLVKVTPKSADALPIAGTILGKMMNIVGRSLTGEDQEGFFFGSSYRIQGNWENPQITPLHEDEGLLQKIWTNFD